MKAVVAVESFGLGGEAEAVEDGIHEFAGGVASERASGAVAAVGSRGEAEDKDAGRGISEAGNRTGPVGAIEVGAALLASDALAVFDEAGTEGAVYYFSFENGQRRRTGVRSRHIAVYAFEGILK